jgi:hypothetical protein
MIIVEKNEGEKIPYDVMGNLLVLNDELYLNLQMYERDFPVQLDVCHNDFDMLTMGLSKSYVAQIDIPAREYELIETDNKNEDGEYISAMMPIPFNIDRVTLILWGVN